MVVFTRSKTDRNALYHAFLNQKANGSKINSNQNNKKLRLFRKEKCRYANWLVQMPAFQPKSKREINRNDRRLVSLWFFFVSGWKSEIKCY